MRGKCDIQSRSALGSVGCRVVYSTSSTVIGPCAKPGPIRNFISSVILCGNTGDPSVLSIRISRKGSWLFLVEDSMSATNMSASAAAYLSRSAVEAFGYFCRRLAAFRSNTTSRASSGSSITRSVILPKLCTAAATLATSLFRAEVLPYQIPLSPEPSVSGVVIKTKIPHMVIFVKLWLRGLDSALRALPLRRARCKHLCASSLYRTSDLTRFARWSLA